MANLKILNAASSSFDLLLKAKYILIPSTTTSKGSENPLLFVRDSRRRRVDPINPPTLSKCVLSVFLDKT